MEYRKRPARRKIALVILAIVVLLALAYAFLNAQLTPALAKMAETRVQAEATKAMYAAVLSCLNDGGDTQFVDIRQTQEQVYYVGVNNGALNRFAANCAALAQKDLSDIGKQGMDLPIGTVIGVPLLAGTGPVLRMTFSPEGAIQTNFSTEFRTAGINQTLHRILLKLTARVVIILPSNARVCTVELQMPVAEHIIVGKVPNTYTDVNNEEDMLNLIPTE